jgi:spermidine synthase
VLGLGGGSIVETIREEFHSDAKITLVEIDPEMITIAKDEFDIERFENITIVGSDAYEYIEKSQEKYDLIVVDIFILDTIPVIFTESIFLDRLSACLGERGKIIYNTMRRTLPREIREDIKTIFITQ